MGAGNYDQEQYYIILMIIPVIVSIVYLEVNLSITLLFMELPVVI